MNYKLFIVILSIIVLIIGFTVITINANFYVALGVYLIIWANNLTLTLRFEDKKYRRKV